MVSFSKWALFLSRCLDEALAKSWVCAPPSQNQWEKEGKEERETKQQQQPTHPWQLRRWWMAQISLWSVAAAADQTGSCCCGLSVKGVAAVIWGAVKGRGVAPIWERERERERAVVVLWEREMEANRGAGKAEGSIFDSIWLPGAFA